MSEAFEQTNSIPDQPIPQYTAWDPLNRQIHLIATEQDVAHPVYGLGEGLLFHGNPWEFNKKDGKHVGVRIVFPKGDRELSYLLGLKPDGSVVVRNEGWCPHLDANEYGPPLPEQRFK